MPKIVFNTAPYELSHFKKPRGDGWWWFEANGQRHCILGSYSYAKTRCKELVADDFPNELSVEVKVLP